MAYRGALVRTDDATRTEALDPVVVLLFLTSRFAPSQVHLVGNSAHVVPLSSHSFGQTDLLLFICLELC